MKSKELIEKYYKAWIDNDRDLARSSVTDDLKFRSPSDNFDSADDFFNTCWKLAKDFNRMDYYHKVYAEDSGYIVYGFDDFAAGELIKIRDSKISEIYVTFNPTR